MKTINAARSLLYCRFVHGTVHPLYWRRISRQTNLPYRLLYIVPPGVFTHDCSVLFTVPPRTYMNGGREERKREYISVHPGHYYRTKSNHFVTKSVHHFGELFYTVLQHFIPNYCTVHHIPLYFFFVLTIGWILHIHFPLDTRYFFIVHCTVFIQNYTVHSLYNIITVSQL